MTNLARSAVQAGKDIKSARVARDRLDAQRLKSKTRAVGGGAVAAGGAKQGEPEQKKARRARPVFEHGPTMGREVPSFGSALLFSAALDAAAEPRSAEQPGSQPPAFDLSCPFIVFDPNLAQVSEQPEVKAAVTGFNAMWKTSRFRITPGRAL